MENKEFRGFLDVLDITGFVLHMWRKQMISLALSSDNEINQLLETPIKEIISN